MRISLEEYCKNHGKIGLLQQWDTEKSLPLTPETVSYGSGKKAWWLCQQQHSLERRYQQQGQGQRLSFLLWKGSNPRPH